MFRNLARLTRYRGLIQSLVARELKARYRGSVLGFFWSFINPLLLLTVYSLVFRHILTPDRAVPNYAVFMFCGILPWTWFASSILESAGVLIAGGNLIKKVLFPAEVLPIVTVLANMVHFCLGLPILFGFILYSGMPLHLTELAWFPVVVLVQLIVTLGFALIVSALPVHIRDLRDILSNLMTFWFFATPIIYSYKSLPEEVIRWVKLNPFTRLAIAYQEILYFDGPVGSGPWILVLGAISIVFFLFGYFVFDRLRDTFAEEV